jgi:hypothetical protein
MEGATGEERWSAAAQELEGRLTLNAAAASYADISAYAEAIQNMADKNLAEYDAMLRSLRVRSQDSPLAAAELLRLLDLFAERRVSLEQKRLAVPVAVKGIQAILGSS